MSPRLLVTAVLLGGCAVAPPLPLDQYLTLRDGARDYLGAVERDACPRASERAKALCQDTREMRTVLGPADQTMIRGYMAKGLSQAQWDQALGIVTSVLGKALKNSIGLGGL